MRPAPSWAHPGQARAQTLLSERFQISLPEGVKGVGSPDVGAQHVKGALLVAILGRRERWLLGRRCPALPSLSRASQEVAQLRAQPCHLHASPTQPPRSPQEHPLKAGRDTRFRPLGHKAADDTEQTTRWLMLAPYFYPPSTVSLGTRPPRPTETQRAGWRAGHKDAQHRRNPGCLSWEGTSKGIWSNQGQ